MFSNMKMDKFIEFRKIFQLKLVAKNIALQSLEVHFIQMRSNLICFRLQRGTSNVALEVLIINCKKYFINLFIFKYLASNIKLFIFSCLNSIFFFPNTYICKQKRTTVCGHASIFSDFKLIWENDDLLSSRHK